MRFSFVLPAYKAKFLKEAVDSILAQTYKEFELIIVNDCSPYDIDGIIQSYHDSRISYFKNEKNIGGQDLVLQWNHCLEFAHGDYIVLASDDDIYDSHYLGIMNILVDKYPDVSILRPRICNIDEDGNIILMEDAFPEGILSKSFFIEQYSRLHLLSGIPQYVFKASSLKSIGGFVNLPMGWYSDDATAIQLASNGIAYTDNLLFYFRQSSINLSSSLSFAHLKDKVTASINFYSLLKKDEMIDSSLLGLLMARIRQLAFHDLRDSKFQNAFPVIVDLLKIRSPLFPMHWILLLMLARIKRRLVSVHYSAGPDFQGLTK